MLKNKSKIREKSALLSDISKQFKHIKSQSAKIDSVTMPGTLEGGGKKKAKFFCLFQKNA